MSKQTTTPPELMKRTNFFLPQSLHDGLKKMKEQRGGSEAEHVRRAVDAYLKRFKLNK